MKHLMAVSCTSKLFINKETILKVLRFWKTLKICWDYSSFWILTIEEYCKTVFPLEWTKPLGPISICSRSPRYMVQQNSWQNQIYARSWTTLEPMASGIVSSTWWRLSRSACLEFSNFVRTDSAVAACNAVLSKHTLYLISKCSSKLVLFHEGQLANLPSTYIVIQLITFGYTIC